MDEIDQVIHIDWELVSLHKQCMNRLMSDRGVYPGQPPLLFTLGRMGACNQADLAKALHISPATIAVSLKRMEKSGFVKRVPDPGDLRSNRIELTERGRRAAASADHAHPQGQPADVPGLHPRGIFPDRAFLPADASKI